MRLFSLFTLLFSLLAPLTAATVKKDILVGAFGTPKQAQFRNMKLEAYLGHDPVVSDLMKRKRFYFDVKYGNGMYRSVLTHFVSPEESMTVLQSVKRIFPDAYMLPTTKSGIPPLKAPAAKQETKRAVTTAQKKPAPKPVPATAVKAAPAAAQQPAAAPHPAPAADAETIDDDIVVIDETQEAEAPAEAVEETKSIVAPVKETTVSETVVPAAESQSSGTSWLLYGIIFAVVVLGGLFALARRKKPQNRALKTPEMIDLDIRSETGEPEAPAEPAQEPAPEIVKEEPPVPVADEVKPETPAPEPEAPAAEPAPVMEEPPAAAPQPEASVSPRKKRALPKNLEGITKESLAEFAGNRILIAEDNVINQKVISKLLDGSGIEFTIANNGQEAIDILTSDPTYNMVLMDAHMPVKDGFEATREIRQNILFEPIVVVALSGDVSSDDIRKMREAGMEEQLAKPLKVDELYKVMYQYLDLEGESEGEALPEPKLHESDVPLNSEEGLEVCGGDMVMYIEILDEFVEEYANADTLVDAYLRANDDGKLVALMLDIKGVAANIGADPLSEAAETLREAVLINQTDAYEKLAAEFNETLHKTLAAIDSFKSAHLK